MSYLLDTPWKGINHFGKWLNFPAAWILFTINGISWGKGWEVFGLPIIMKHRKSTITIGNSMNLRSNRFSNPLVPSHPVVLCTWEINSVIEIGDNFGMTGGTICSTKAITIGNNVVIGANSYIVDTDFHPINLETRRIVSSGGKSDPVIIGDDVFIGMNSLILKGVKLGNGSVIGAGSVVTRNIPENTIAAGNPARVIGEI